LQVLEFVMRIPLFLAASTLSLAVAAVAPAPFAVAATTVQVQQFGNLVTGLRIGDALSAQSLFHAGTSLVAAEDFDADPQPGGFIPNVSTTGNAFSPATPASPNAWLRTGVGDFRAIGSSSGTGSTAVGPFNAVQVRNGLTTTGAATTSGKIAGGRYDTSDADGTGAAEGSEQYLDSNDTGGIEWRIPGDPAAFTQRFDRLSFMTSDIDDVGAVTFRLTLGSSTVLYNLAQALGGARRPNGELLLFTIAFDTLIDGSSFRMTIDSGDGFAFDTAKISATPLPAAAWMLIAGVGALFGLGRLRKAAA
jgi:hypothetical protein